MGYQQGITIAQDTLLELARKDAILDKLSAAYSELKKITVKDVDSDYTFTEINEWLQDYLEATSPDSKESYEVKQRVLIGLVIQVVLICSGILQMNSASKVINGNDGEE